MEGVKEAGREGGWVGKEIHFLIHAHKFTHIAYNNVIVEVIDHTLNQLLQMKTFRNFS